MNKSHTEYVLSILEMLIDAEYQPTALRNKVVVHYNNEELCAWCNLTGLNFIISGCTGETIISLLPT